MKVSKYTFTFKTNDEYYLPEFDTLIGQKMAKIEATDRCNGDL